MAFDVSLDSPIYWVVGQGNGLKDASPAPRKLQNCYGIISHDWEPQVDKGKFLLSL